MPNNVQRFNLNSVNKNLKYTVHSFGYNIYFNRMDILEKLYYNVRRQIRNLPATVPKTIDLVNKTVSNVRLPPFTKDNVLYYYLPLQGLVSYTTLSVSVMNPHIMVR